MNENPKSIWKKSFARTGWFSAWIILLGAAFVIILTIAGLTKNLPDHSWLWLPCLVFSFIYSAVIATIFICLCKAIRWLFCRRNLKRSLFVLACFVTLIALFYAEEDWRGKHDWEKFKHEWEAKGEHFDFASVIPPPVPDDQNFALMPVVFTSYGFLLGRDGKEIPYEHRDTNLVRRMDISRSHNNKEPATNGIGNWQSARISDLKIWQNYYRTLAATNEFPTTPMPQTPAQDVLLALSEYDSTIEELRRASELSYSRFPLNYDNENPSRIFIPHLSALKRCVEVLQLRAIAELQNGESEKALQDVELSFYLANSIRVEPIPISHLVRIALLNLALQPVWEGLAEHQWSSAQLVELELALAKIDLFTDYGMVIRGERAIGIGVIEFLQYNRSFHKLAEVTGMDQKHGDDDQSSKPLFFINMVYKLSPNGWFDQNKLRLARFETKWYLPLVDAENKIVSPKSAERAGYAATVEVGATRTTPYNWFVKMLLPAFASVAKKFASAQCSIDLARTAIALERYRLVHGEYPESLDVLVPQFIAQVPHDVIGGQPLKYRREANGQFILYSVGWNETDDGGIIGYRKGGLAPDFEAGDWVWRYPQK